MMQLARKFFTAKSAFNFNILRPFSTKSEVEIKSVPGNKPPIIEDSVQGKYAGVLFSSASSKQALFEVLQDMRYFKQLYSESEQFRGFLANIALKRTQQLEVLQGLGKDGFNEITNNFLGALVENRRLDSLPKVADKYIDYYRILNKEENIIIISANELNNDDKDKIVAALKKSQEGVTFTISYQIDPTILGGLQMYCGNKFLDCSLLSRITKLKSELAKVSF